MTRDEILKRYPRASESFLRANATDGARPRPVVERSAGVGTLGPKKTKAVDPRKFLVRVTSFRRRLLDIDNLCEKFHVDCCRYAGILPSDAPGQTKIEVSQQKVASKEEERTEIEILTENL